MEDSILINKFNGGISPYLKLSIESGSCRECYRLNVHEDPSYATLQPKATDISGGVVVDLIKWIVDGSPFDTNRYAYDKSGNIYKINSDNEVTLLVSGASIGNNAKGQGLAVFDNYLYYATGTTLGRYGPLDGTPAFNHDFLSDGTTNVDQSATTTGNTYTLLTSISEGATDKLTFTPTRDPLKSVQVYVVSKGSADWTLTLHDSNNTVVGTATVLNASLTDGQYNTFTFASPIRLTISNQYHIHLTVPSGTSTSGTATANDLSTLAYKTIFGILINDDDYHPIIEMLNFLTVGNYNYTAKWDRATYNPNRVTLRSGMKTRSKTRTKEFLLTACWQGTDIDSVEMGRVYYWDGSSTTFNYFDDIPNGLPNVIHNTQSRTLGVYGSSASLHVGKTTAGLLTEIQDIGSPSRGKKVDIYPGAVAEWQRKSYIGLSGSTDDTELLQGVYEYGSKDSRLPDALVYAFKPSTDNDTGTSVGVGCVSAFGKDLYFSWKDGVLYGLDHVAKNGDACTSGKWVSLIHDAGNPLREKVAKTIIIEFYPLASGESVTPLYAKDADIYTASYTEGLEISTVGATTAKLDLTTNTSYKEFVFGFELKSSSGSYPKVKSVLYIFDDCEEEVSYTNG